MSTLLNKESVSKRLESKEGISFTEFSYQILQAYDYYKLFQSKNCILQIGGSDQWGNITNGCEFVKKVYLLIKFLLSILINNLNFKKLSKEVFGLTTPLLTTKAGQKFGKSEVIYK